MVGCRMSDIGWMSDGWLGTYWLGTYCAVVVCRTITIYGLLIIIISLRRKKEEGREGYPQPRNTAKAVPRV